MKRALLGIAALIGAVLVAGCDRTPRFIALDVKGYVQGQLHNPDLFVHVDAVGVIENVGLEVATVCGWTSESGDYLTDSHPFTLRYNALAEGTGVEDKGPVFSYNPPSGETADICTSLSRNGLVMGALGMSGKYYNVASTKTPTLDPVMFNIGGDVTGVLAVSNSGTLVVSDLAFATVYVGNPSVGFTELPPLDPSYPISVGWSVTEANAARVYGASGHNPTQNFEAVVWDLASGGPPTMLSPGNPSKGFDTVFAATADGSIAVGTATDSDFNDMFAIWQSDQKFDVEDGGPAAQQQTPGDLRCVGESSDKAEMIAGGTSDDSARLVLPATSGGYWAQPLDTWVRTNFGGTDPGTLVDVPGCTLGTTFGYAVSNGADGGAWLFAFPSSVGAR